MVARRLSILVLGLACLGLTVQSTLGQGGGTTDTLRFRNPKKDYAEERANGVITETAGIVKVVANNKTLAEVPASRVVAIDYTGLPGLEKSLTDLRSAENQGVALKARDLYTAELKKNPADPKTKRYLDYREAHWSLKVVEGKTGDAFKAEAPALIAKLKGFTQEYAKKNARHRSASSRDGQLRRCRFVVHVSCEDRQSPAGFEAGSPPRRVAVPHG
jgi:hypothetical protein